MGDKRWAAKAHLRECGPPRVTETSVSDRGLFEENPRLVVFGSRPLLGQSKWLGGALGPDNLVYGVPGDAEGVLRVDPKTLEVDVIGGPFPGKNKWLRGITARDGNIYCLPACAHRVLRISPGGDVREIGPSFEEFGNWKWHGGAMADNGIIYAVPCNATAVLKVDPASGDISLIGGPFPGRQKWYGGLIGSDGAIYGVPQNATGVLRVDPKDESCAVLGSFPEGGWKWHGGVADADRNIWCIPNHASRVLKVDTARQEVYEVGDVLDGPDFGYLGGKYKYLGGVLAGNGDVYFMPGYSLRVLKVETRTETVRLVGQVLSDKANKWQNGYLGPDGAVYGIPVTAKKVLRISPDDEVTLMDGCPDTQDAYEGGVEVDGELVCIPMRARRVMKVVPKRRRSAGAMLRSILPWP